MAADHVPMLSKEEGDSPLNLSVDPDRDRTHISKWTVRAALVATASLAVTIGALSSTSSDLHFRGVPANTEAAFLLEETLNLSNKSHGAIEKNLTEEMKSAEDHEPAKDNNSTLETSSAKEPTSGEEDTPTGEEDLEKDHTSTKSAADRECIEIPGVQLAEPEKLLPAWKECSAKWAEDCSQSGCCIDWDMKCYKKDSKWSACNSKCSSKDEKNESWACDEVYPPKPRTWESCLAECKAQEDCKQAVFSGEGPGWCHLSAERLPTVTWAADNFNSTFCGSADEQKKVKEAVEKVNGQLPFVVSLPLVNCSWGGEDCSETKCCNDNICDKDYNNCYGYSCYKKTEYFSGCAAEAPEGWDGTWIGGPRERRVIPPAGAQVAVHGNSLYCFSVVTWDAPRPKPFWNSEAELANNWKEKGLHVLQCDGSDILDGVQTPVAEWGSFSNIDMFMDIWKRVRDIGKWQQFDWTVKVDADAVFFPQRLKDHLYNLRTPAGSRVYLENIDYKFKMMGAIEIMTKEALTVFLERGHECIRGEHAGGEDSFLKGCLDGLGVDHQSDYTILRDKYAKMNGPCTDGWAVAYHYMKKTHDWAGCYNEAMCGPEWWATDCEAAIQASSEI